MNGKHVEVNKRKAIGGIILGMVICFVLLAIGIKVSQWVSLRDSRAMAKLFSKTELTEVTDTPVIKSPYTVYTRNNDGQWEYRKSIYDTELISGEGITEKVKDCRTCIFIWADTYDQTKSDNYYWGTTDTYGEDAYFSPVYMTVVDREAGVRYEDIKLGSVPLSERSTRFAGKYSGNLYDPDREWSTFDLNAWYRSHLESGS